MTRPNEELEALLTSLGGPVAIYRRLWAAEPDGDEVDDDELARRAGYVSAACTAAALGDATALGWIDGVLRRARDEDWEGRSARGAAARHLASWLRRRAERDGPAAFAGRIERMAAHPQPRVRAAAAEALLPRRDDPALAGFASALLHDPDPAVRWSARSPGDPAGTGLLPPGAPATLEPALAEALDPRKPRHGHRSPPGPAFEPALAALPDALALQILPRLVGATYTPDRRDAQVLQALLPRPGGLDAFLAEVVPRLAAAGALEYWWERPVAGPLAALPRASVVPALLDAAGRDPPPPGFHQEGLHPGRFAARILQMLAPFDPEPLRSLLGRFGDGAPDDFGARWELVNALRKALAACEKGGTT